jgi:protein-S-isoprenylcysteine O-methyltransferase Ste14
VIFLERKVLAPTVLGALMLLVIFPFVVGFLIPMLDQGLELLVRDWAGIFGLMLFPFGLVLGVVVWGSGFAFAIWSFVALYRIGKGSPAPFLPTKNLVIVGPYRHSRNPMAFGVAITYLGYGLLLGSAAFALVTICAMVLPYLFYIRFIEEKELIGRFGESYTEYASQTRFILPIPKKRGEKSE